MKTAIEILDEKKYVFRAPIIEVGGKEFIAKYLALEAMEEYAVQFGKPCCCNKSKQDEIQQHT